MKFRIFALSKELDIDSKELIQHCLDAGLDVKSSALASISPEERDILMKHLEKVQAGAPPRATSEIPKPIEMNRPMAPREIRTIGAPPPQLRRAPRKESATQPEAEQAAASNAPPAEVELEAPPVETVAPAPVVPAVSEPEEATPPTPAPVAEAVEAPSPVETSDDNDDAEAEQDPRQTPMNRADYIAPGGTRSLGGMREMQARGNVRDAEARAKKRDKKAPALPSLAASPNFKLSTPTKKHEGPVQKPDLALTGDVLKNNKLSEILRKKTKDDSKRRDITEDETPVSRGKPGSSLSLEDARAQRRNKRNRKRGDDDDDRVVHKSHKRSRRHSNVELKSEATVASPITVRTLSEATGRPAKEIQTILFRAQGVMATINDALDDELAMEVCLEMGVDLTIDRQDDIEDQLTARLSRSSDDMGVTTVHRPPIITVLGHVDHGKTTLVDRIRSSNVAAGEAGGITQHIAAYQVDHNGQKLTFVDTPGHAAFGEMRARGANVTDIIVLVVAADDGVMPQTVECISHAKAAGVPIVVAMNKIDLPAANEQKVLTDLSQHGILPQEWGGDVEVIRVSALQGTGIDDLLETLLLTAEIQDLKAPEDIPAEGVCLEAFLDEGRGPIAWAIVRRGILRVGDVVLCGKAIGRVRAMYNDRDQELKEAGPSTPVKLAGLDDVPGAGDRLFVMDSIEEARKVADERELRGRTETLARRSGLVSLEDFFMIRDGGLKDLPLIIKADTPGSIEALRHELERFEHDEVRIKILHEGVGGVNESDVYLAASSGAIIVAFHVIAEDRAEALAHQEGVDVRRYNIIYNVTAEIRQALEGLLKPERVEVATGRALVLRTFSISRVGTVAGCRVLNGTIERSNRVHVIRDQKILNDYSIASLKREKDDAKEVREGFECGIRLDGFNDVKEGDLLEAFRIEERRRSLDE
ncbi:MAG: translation initiation factor IF-2 [Planctomycetaceae bacterium]|nr:translation initiation factor IF-2 [Planctomycetaceae bacterium]